MLHDEGCCFALFPISKEDEIKFSSDKMEMNLSIGATISKKKKKISCYIVSICIL